MTDLINPKTSTRKIVRVTGQEGQSEELASKDYTDVDLRPSIRFTPLDARLGQRRVPFLMILLIEQNQGRN